MERRERQEAEVASNYVVFEAELPTLMRDRANQYAAYRCGKRVGIFKEFGDAVLYCRSRFEDGFFSVQEITDQPLEIGWFRYAADDTVLQPAGGDTY